MGTANIYGFPNSQAHSPRNAFGLSHDKLFTSPVGMILPAFVDDIKEGDKYSLSCKNFTRTDNVNTAAFTSFDEKVDFWFVPYRLLWSAYEQWRLGTTQSRSTTDLQQIGGLVKHPCGKWSDFLVKNSSGQDVLAFDSFDYTYRYGVGFLSSMVRMLDLLGYGLLPLDNITQHNSVKELTADEKSTLINFLKKLNSNFDFNWFRLAAYQCVYQHAYRNEDYESLNPSYYNCDSLFISNRIGFDGGAILPNILPEDYDSNISSPYHLYHGLTPNNNSGNISLNQKNENRLTLQKLFTPRYKNYRRDLFSTMKPTNGVVDFYTQDSLDNGSFSGGLLGSSVSFPDPFETDNTSNDPSGVTPNVGPNLYQETAEGDSFYLSAVQLRSLMAMDKFARLALYSDKNYSALYKSLLGVSVSEPDVPRYLGSFSSNITINEVVSTSSGTATVNGTTKSSVLGELAGKGTGGSQSKVFSESFKEAGIIIGMHYIMPYNYFNPYRIDPFTRKSSRYDYYYPSFDGLGLSPVYLSEFCYYGLDDVTLNRLNTVLGFNTRYHEYKQRVNTVHGTFAPGQPDYNWTLTINDYPTVANEYIYKIAPNVSDSVFGVNWNGAMITDPFKCFYSFNVMKVSNMEAVGVPNT